MDTIETDRILDAFEDALTALWEQLEHLLAPSVAVETTSRTCLQVCGAIGLTSEHPLGGYVKRFRTLEALYGGWQRTMHSVGEQLLASRVVPRGVGV